MDNEGRVQRGDGVDGGYEGQGQSISIAIDQGHVFTTTKALQFPHLFLPAAIESSGPRLTYVDESTQELGFGDGYVHTYNV
jgi:hypothetical protein